MAETKITGAKRKSKIHAWPIRPNCRLLMVMKYTWNKCLIEINRMIVKDMKTLNQIVCLELWTAVELAS